MLEKLSEIDKAIAENTEVAFYGDHAMQQTIQTLQRAGFTEINAKKIINGHPNILRLDPFDIAQRLEIWHFCHFTHTQLFDLFVQCPELIEFDDEPSLSKRYGQLRSIVATPKNIWRLLMSCPNVLVDDMRTIKQKVDYVLNEMEADVTDLVKSGTLGLPLKQIRTRHTLLVRLGFHKKRNWRSSELSENKNLRLFRIMDVNDAKFAIKTCGISTKELEAFTELYEREMEEDTQAAIEYAEDSDFESDGGSESDDDNFDARENNDYYDDRKKRRYKRKR